MTHKVSVCYLCLLLAATSLATPIATSPTTEKRTEQQGASLIVVETEMPAEFNTKGEATVTPVINAAETSTAETASETPKTAEAETTSETLRTAEAVTAAETPTATTVTEATTAGTTATTDAATETSPAEATASSASTTTAVTEAQAAPEATASTPDTKTPEATAETDTPPAPAHQAKKKVKLLIAVESSPNHVRQRNAIRDSWAQDAQALGIDVKFFIGELGLLPKNEQQEKAITDEPNVIRLHDFSEKHENLPRKTLDVFAYGDALKYSAVFKVYDSTYVFPELLLKALEHSSVSNVEELFGGMFVKSEALRQPSHQPGSRGYMDDQLPELTNPNALLPEYPWGNAVLLGRSGSKHLRKQRPTLQMLRRDDVALATWVSDVSLTKIELPGSIYLPEISPSNPNQSVWAAPLTPTEMKDLHSGKSVQLQSCQQGCMCFKSIDPNTEIQENSSIKDCWKQFRDLSWSDAMGKMA
eukprot:c8355_g1_i1.p1 GENE.c8355_g1_i1~~c8355_g1_i1.p1  ORF type:complete len:474 (-),score=148.33 c8355_g1_i1:193-1614(-)